MSCKNNQPSQKSFFGNIQSLPPHRLKRRQQMEPLRVGLIGAGWVMPYHLMGWRAAAGQAEVVAVADPNAEAREKLAEEYRIPAQYEDFLELLQRADINVVDIAAPTALHAEIATAAAQAGKHVLCEKPFACTAEQCRRMADAARQAGVLLMPLHNRILSPSVRETKRLLEEGMMGQPRLFRGSFIARGYPRDNWRGQPAFSGGGVAIEAGVHLIYTAEHLVGRIAAVNAQTTQFVPDPLPIEDAVVVDVRFASGALGVFTFAYGSAYFDDGCQVIGSEGAILLHGIEGQAFRQPPVQVYTAQDDSWREPHIDWSWPQSFVGTIGHFVRCVQGKEPPIITPQDGISAISVVEAIYRSAAEGQRVEVARG